MEITFIGKINDNITPKEILVEYKEDFDISTSDKEIVIYFPDASAGDQNRLYSLLPLIKERAQKKHYEITRFSIQIVDREHKIFTHYATTDEDRVRDLVTFVLNEHQYKLDKK